MTAIERERFRLLVLKLADAHGPWAVLLEFTQIMKRPFREQAERDKPPKRQKKNNDAALEPPEFVNPMPFGSEQ